jgi:hypothetical protein
MTTFCTSSNGDRWLMLHDGETGRYTVRHEPNLSSGGQATEVGGPEFLSRNTLSPQGQALAQLLAKDGAIDPDLDAYQPA